MARYIRGLKMITVVTRIADNQHGTGGYGAIWVVEPRIFFATPPLCSKIEILKTTTKTQNSVVALKSLNITVTLEENAKCRFYPNVSPFHPTY